MRRAGSTVCVALAALLVAGCGPFGDGDEDQGPRLSAADKEQVTRGEVDIENFCQLAAKDGEGGVDAKLRPFNDSRIVMEIGVDKLIAIHRKDPEAVFQPGSEGEKRSMNEVLADAASRLRDECESDGREQARRLDRVLSR